jgi:ornithine carbamoyltransferase
MIDDVREFKRVLEEIRWLDAQLCGKNFFLTWKQSLKEVQQVLYTAEALKWLQENNISTKCFESGLAVLQVRDQTVPEDIPGTTQARWPLWTLWNRLSFVSAANLLGLAILQVNPGESDIPAAALSLLAGTEVMGVQYPKPEAEEEQADPGESESKDESRSLNRLPGVIHLLNHLDHPSRAMADMLQLKDHFGSLERLQGKKIAITWCNSFETVSSTSTACSLPATPPAVPQGIVALVTRFGMEVTLAYPEGFALNPGVIEAAHQHAQDSGGRFTVFSSMDQAVAGAEAVYPVNWTSATAGEKKLESGAWRYGPDQVKQTQDGCALTLGCEPAAGYHSHMIAAMIVNNRFKEPARLLENLRKRNIKRLIYPV